MKTSPQELQIDAFLAKYSPAVSADLRAARTRLRALFAQGFELVFDNYNALVFGISPSERASESFVSVVGYPKWVTLFFLHGATLHDPAGLLEGKGKQIRSIRLKAPVDIDKPEVKELIMQAARPYESLLQTAPPLTTVIKMVLATQRSRQPASNLPTAKPD